MISTNAEKAVFLRSRNWCRDGQYYIEQMGMKEGLRFHINVHDIQEGDMLKCTCINGESAIEICDLLNSNLHKR
jgi:hypothetical protein